jgi:hypothetical protein
MRYVLILAVALVLGGCGVSDEDAGDGGVDGDSAQADVGAPGTDAAADAATEIATETDDAEVAGGQSPLQIGAKLLDFGNLEAGELAEMRLVIRNISTEPLRVVAFLLKGSATFSLVRYDSDGATTGVWNASAETATGVTIQPRLILGAGETSDVLGMRFTPSTPGVATGRLTLFANAVMPDGPAVVTLRGNVTGPRLCVSPWAVDFGHNPVGSTATRQVTLKNCGDGGDLTIHEIALNPDSGGPFSLGLESLGAGAPKIVLGPQATKTFEVVYAPGVASPVGVDDWAVPETALVNFKTDAFEADGQVEISGSAGAIEDFVTARIEVLEGEEVIPQTKLHLIGSKSNVQNGPVKRFEWRVKQPSGSQSVFLPSFEAPDPTFEVNAAGTYQFRLDVWDQNDQKSPTPAFLTVAVIPDEAIHVELLWTTEGDPNQTDEGQEAGADLDLHFAHPLAALGQPDVDGDGAPDPWFDIPYDCFWFNAHPNWGSLNPTVDDNPGLDRDDTDGVGPENMNLNLPEDDTVYRVAVHYWSDHTFGPSLATVRVYVYGVLSYESKDVELEHKDLWEVVSIGWPSGLMFPAKSSSGGQKIFPDYPYPVFPPP